MSVYDIHKMNHKTAKEEQQKNKNSQNVSTYRVNTVNKIAVFLEVVLFPLDTYHI